MTGHDRPDSHDPLGAEDRPSDPLGTPSVLKSLTIGGLGDYIDGLTPADPPPVAALAVATDRLGAVAHYQMTRPQRALLRILLMATGARRFLEIGTFTGLTTLTAALTLPPDGEVVTLDAEPSFPAIGRPFWQQAGVDGRIRLMLGDAHDSLAALLDGGESGRFDLALVDADKRGYPDYFERALSLLRPGGLMLLDNVLWRGQVLDPADQGRKARLFRRLNQDICNDARVESTLLPVGDGMLLVCKRADGGNPMGGL